MTFHIFRTVFIAFTLTCTVHAQFLGFDRNDYPGDTSLKELRKHFSYAGYWLNNPPGSSTNTWSGKRAQLETEGFGFLVLFNGRLYSELKNVQHATDLGNADAQQAVRGAQREEFPPHTIIFLDQEEGGRLLPEQKAYLFAWVDRVEKGGYGAGVYCSGIAAKERGGASVITAQDIRESAGARKIAYWVTNDACPPSPGCVLKAIGPSGSGIEFADVWQFAQSPKRKDVAKACSGYKPDGNCYAGSGSAAGLHLDLNAAKSTDPSHGRTH